MARLGFFNRVLRRVGKPSTRTAPVLKHDSSGLGAGRDANFDHALEAVEELLTIVEACPVLL